MAKPKKEKDLRSDWTPGPTEFEGEEVEQNLTFAPWRPKEGDRRTLVFLGFKSAHSKEFDKDFNIYHGRDLKTGEFFSFVPGGLFDYIIKENNIVTGMRLGVQFAGQAKLPGGPANQWVIVKLKTPEMVKD
jgi:hypothetical protein